MHHPRWGLAVARLETRQTVPLPIARRPRLRTEDWALLLAVDDGGRPEPFAGVFTSGLGQTRRPWAKLMATSRPGSAVLDTEGRLIGVALDRGKRFTRVVSIRRVAAWLKNLEGAPQ